MKKIRFLAFVLMSLFGCSFFSPCVSARDLKSVAQEYVPKLEKNLRENIIPFWLDKSLDPENGGYHMHFSLKSERLPQSGKMIVTQSRQLWMFSRLYREGYGGKELLDAADLGYRFLREKMWDAKNGGFYWMVDNPGGRAIMSGKVLYGQAFGLYAVSEYCLASRKSEALEFATQIFMAMENKAHDSIYGGYQEAFTEDWNPAPLSREVIGSGGVKDMNTHLHIMEAVAAFYRASQQPLARERLLELITIQSNAVVRKGIGACTDRYERNWTPRLTGIEARVSYGHDIENVWLLQDACGTARISAYPLLDLFQTLFQYSYKYGFDTEKGGFFSRGEFNRPASDRTKVWWVQAEALVSALYLYRMTQDPKFLDVFCSTYDFVEKFQVDWTHGEWYARVNPEGRGQGDKGEPWKGGYHNSRSMMECLRILKPALSPEGK